MAAIIELSPLSDQAPEILDELQQQTRVYPFMTTGSGVRTYHVTSGDVDAFDAMLDRIEPEWREHLAR